MRECTLDELLVVASTEAVHIIENQQQQDEHVSEEECDREFAEDEEVFHHLVQLRGLTNDSFLQQEDLQTMADNVFSVAPAEGHRPIGILNDQHFEEMCNSTKYPTGKFGLMTKREVNFLMQMGDSPGTLSIY